MMLIKLDASTTIDKSIGPLVSCFHVFNIEYLASSKNLEVAMMQRTTAEKPRREWQ